MDIGPAWGALAVGMMLNLILYGFMFMQCYIYLSTFKKDVFWIKIFVFYLFIADTVDTAFTAAILYDYLISHFGELEYLGRATWVFCTDPAMTGIISCSVQLFFAYRVKRLTGHRWVAIVISFLACASCCGALGSAIAVNWWHEFVQFQKFQEVVIIWLVCAAVADVVITCTLVWYLRGKRTGFVATDDIIDRITRMTIQTGFLTAVFAVVDVILFLASSSDTHLLFNLPLSKLYTNSLMSNLNSRAGWEGTSSKLTHSSDSDHARPSFQRRKPGAPNVLIISKDVTSVTDGGAQSFAPFSGYNQHEIQTHEMDVIKAPRDSLGSAPQKGNDTYV
ncbi:hypothetical protein HETIRDRAFT_442492 [Heterobasidion irregulare TC 32-1]|uniref:DUF6534 domain-containing protein n=1 Tax=Heterobasidion irregulare (strain TC 32-1) TaxID=747525 RepID=W4JQB9_HETIT|nr:uncharacterized protein HETIRDRAFT_442492 [Heterobasidion irregulare TC 32-1]ETW75270.1 hypothetical protein HETIRDRAFT_442492 [Heterobasidion irregulare TC 32-1]